MAFRQVQVLSMAFTSRVAFRGVLETRSFDFSLDKSRCLQLRVIVKVLLSLFRLFELLSIAFIHFKGNFVF